MFPNFSKLATIIAVGFLPFVSADTAPFDDWDHGRVQLSNVSIHFRYAGSGPPLLLVHGNPQHSVSFTDICCWFFHRSLFYYIAVYLACYGPYPRFSFHNHCS